MTEVEAHDWLATHVPRETIPHLEKLAQLVSSAAEAHSLVSASTIDHLWARHIVDSAQLSRFTKPGRLLDIGPGAGFPGLVLALLSDAPILLLEPRRLRARFLSEATAALGLRQAEVVQQRVESFAAPPVATIVARAVAPLSRLFAMAGHLADPGTRWVLPKGRSVHSELAAAQETWHGNFRLVNSISDPEAMIVIATGVARKGGRGQGR